MQKQLIGFAAAVLLSSATGAIADPAQPGADMGAHCDWVTPALPDGPPGNFPSFIAQLGKDHPVHISEVRQAQAKGEPFPPNPPAADDTKGVGGDNKRLLGLVCNMPLPAP